MKVSEPKPDSATACSQKQTAFFNKAEGNFLSKETISDTAPFFSNKSPSVNATVIQAKLTIGQPDDIYEQEADAMADKVVQRLSAPEIDAKKENSIQAKPIASEITPLIQTKCTKCEQEKLQKKEEDNVDLEDREIQRKPAFESAEPPEDEKEVQRKCAECAEKDEKKLQMKTDGSFSNASQSVESSLSSSKGSGTSMSADMRTQMESSFDTDFSDVKIHTDSNAVQMSKDINAQAFTHGSDIYFNSGKYDTNSSGGKHLLAHELTHTIQQTNNGNSGSGVIRRDVLKPGDEITQARCNSTDECVLNYKKLEVYISNILRLKFINLSSQTDNIEFGELLAGIFKDQLPDTINVRSEIKQRAEHLAFEQALYNNDLIDAVTAIKDLVEVSDFAASSLGIEGFAISEVPDRILSVVISHIFRYMMGSLDPVPIDISNASEEAFLSYQSDLEYIAKLVREPLVYLNAELEGAVVELINAREAFRNSMDDNERMANGKKIGEMARYSILLNNQIETLKSKNTKPTFSVLEDVLMDAITEIGSARSAATTEKYSLEETGDDLALLTRQPISINEPFLTQGNQSSVSINPEEAFPTTSDKATEGFMQTLMTQINNQKNELNRLRQQIIPASPTYEVLEFLDVFIQWHSFFSNEQERQNLYFKFWTEGILGVDTRTGKSNMGAYQLMGVNMHNKLSNMSGAVSRFLTIQFAVDGLTHAMGSSTTDFNNSLGEPKLNRNAPDVFGTASNPNYWFAEVYNDPLTGMSSKGETESQSRERNLNQFDTSYSDKFNKIFDAQDQDKITIAENLNIIPPGRGNIPFVNLHSTDAQKGWNYLIDVKSESDLMSPDDDPVSREHKTVPRAVVNYLMAQRQFHATLADQHIPLYQKKVLGDSSISQGGVEKANPAGVSKYLQGKKDPVSPISENLASLISTSKKVDEDNPGLKGLIKDMETYLDNFFVFNPDIGFRLWAVMSIGSIEFHLYERIKHILDPKRIKGVAIFSFRISAITNLLSKAGPLGQIISKGIHAHYGALGVTDLAACAGIAGFFWGVKDTGNLNSARAWAVASIAVADDLEALFDNIINKIGSSAGKLASDYAVGKMGEAMGMAPPKGTKDLAKAIRPLIDSNPEAREAIHRGVKEGLQDLDSKGINAANPNEEYRALLAFNAELDAHEVAMKSISPEKRKQAESNAKKIANEPLPGVATDYETSGRSFRLRTDKEKALLRETIPPELRDKVIIAEAQNSDTTVRIMYNKDGNGKIILLVGGGVEKINIEDHLPALKEISRYTGFSGSLIRAKEKLVSLAMGGNPVYGDLGKEVDIDIRKLDGIIQERSNRLSSDPALLNNPAERAKIEQEIDDYSRQIVDLFENINSRNPAKGFVAAEDNRTLGKKLAEGKGFKDDAPSGYYWRKTKTGGLELVNYTGNRIKENGEEFVLKYNEATNKIEKVNVKDIQRSYQRPLFQSDTWEGAFKDLGGLDKNLSFGRYVENLRIYFKLSNEEIIDWMRFTRDGKLRAASPEGLGADNIRGTTKDYLFAQKILPYLTSKDHIVVSAEYKALVAGGVKPNKAYLQVSHQRMLKYTSTLDSADKGNIAEKWYENVYGKGLDKHVEVPAAEMAKLGVDIQTDRFLDRVEGNTLIELKNISGRLGDFEKQQFNAHMEMANRKLKVVVNGEKVTIKNVHWKFLNPEAAEENRAWMLGELEKHDNLTFVIFNSRGEFKEISADRNKSFLSDPVKLGAWLGL